jgi:hypothetical protein
MSRSQVLAMLWLSALPPITLRLGALFATYRRLKVVEPVPLSAYLIYIGPALLALLPGLLGVSIARRRSNQTFIVWVASTLIVEFVVILMCLDVLAPDPRGIVLVYIGACALSFIDSLSRARMPEPSDRPESPTSRFDKG